MKIGFTGTQRGMTEVQFEAVASLIDRYRAENPLVSVAHGDCVGADEQLNAICDELDVLVIIHPPILETKRAFCWNGELRTIVRPARSYRERNRDIAEGKDLLIATPGDGEEVIRSGTWMTVRMARKAGVPIIIVYPDGNVRREDGRDRS